MARSTIKEKKVGFHRAYLIINGRRSDPTVPIDWVQEFSTLEDKPLDELMVDEHIFAPKVMDGVAVLAMHKPLDTTFMSLIQSGKATTVEDLMNITESRDHENDEEIEDVLPQFAHSTAVVFTCIPNVVGMALGSGAASPKQGALTKFLETYFPPGPGAYWKTEAVMATEQIREFEESSGIVAFSGRYTTARNLFDAEVDEGITSYLDEMAVDVGGDLEVTLSVRLTPAHRTPVRQGKLKASVHKALKVFATNRESKALATVIKSDGLQEEISLVQHSLSESVEIDTADLESQQFSALTAKAKDVCAEAEDGLRRLLLDKDEAGGHGASA